METYKTKDLGEAAALFTHGIQLIELERENDYYVFIFETKKAKEVSYLYWFGNLMVNAKRYNDSLRTLKDRLFAYKV